MNILLHTYLVFCLMLLGCFHAQAQVGYSIEGEDIVFTFDVRDYDQVTVAGTEVTLELADIKLNKLEVAGTFNGWTGDGWRLDRQDEYHFSLRKKVKELEATGSNEFKFLINERFWVEPPADATNVSVSDVSTIFSKVYNLTFDTASVNEDGNYLFYLEGYPDAKEVILSGTFNNWSWVRYEMKKKNGRWELGVDLPAGRHEYRFIVDGTWMEDPHNPHKVKNEFDEYNSVIEKSVDFTFTLQGYEKAKNVYLAGDFTNWEHDKIPMALDDGKWKVEVCLPGGKHHYKFIVDGKWILDPSNELTEFAADGHLNSVMLSR